MVDEKYGNGPEVNSEDERKGRKSVSGLIPLFSRRSIIALSIGLIIGASLGLGYWVISPNVDFRAEWPPISIREPASLYEGSVTIQVLDNSATYVDLKARSRQAEYWANKLQSTAFFEWLNQLLEEQAPQYSHTPEEFSEMIWARFDGVSPEFEVRVTGESPEEIYYHCGVIPQAFKDYLIAQEHTALTAEYDATQERIDRIIIELDEARIQLNNLLIENNDADQSIYQSYIKAVATIDAFERQLAELTDQIAALIAAGMEEQSQGYQDIMVEIDRVIAALVTANNELTILTTQIDSSSDPNFLIAMATVNTLETWLRTATANLYALTINTFEEPDVIQSFYICEPTTPAALPPERVAGRNAIIMGGILGIGLTWTTLNRKWIFNGMFAPRETDDDEEDA